jgi:hypothetical protein
MRRAISRSIGTSRSYRSGSSAAATQLGAPIWERRLRLTLDAMRGAALRNSFEPRDRPGRDPWPELRQALRELLLADSPRRKST